MADSADALWLPQESNGTRTLRRGTVRSITQVLRQYLEDQIAVGRYPLGTWLPSVRELAGEVGVNRNTVSKVYKLLARDRLLEARPGKGVRVVSVRPSADSLASRFDETLEAIVRQAQGSGLSRQWVLDSVQRTVSEIFGLDTIRVAFVECNEEAARILARDLSGHLGVRVDPVVLAELRRAPGDYGRRFDVLSTTLFHLQETEDALGGMAGRVVGINHEVSYETILEIARLPAGARVIVVCPNTRTIEKVQHVVRAYARGEIEWVTEGDPSALRTGLARAQAVIATPSARPRLDGLRPGVPVVWLRFHINEQSLEHMRGVVRRVQERSLASPTQA